MNSVAPIFRSILVLLVLPVAAHVSAYAQGQYPPLTIPHYQDAPPSVLPQTAPPPSRPVIPRTTGYRPPLAGDVSVTFRSDVLSPFVDRKSVQSKSVATQIMEADVRGVQTTATTVRLRSTPSTDIARLHIDTQGHVSSNTVGVTSQARVATLGTHQFLVTKPVFFDGQRFLTKPAYGSLHVTQSPQAVTTVAAGIPLIGQIGQRIAWKEVYRRMPVTDSIVARQVADEVVPQVNASVDKGLVDLNRTWRKFRSQIDALPIGPALSWAAFSTPESFSLTIVNKSITERSANPRQQLLPDLSKQEAVAIVLSEDGINNILDRLPIAGQTYSDSSLQQLVQSVQAAKGDIAQIQDALWSVVQSDPDPMMLSVRMADRRPLRVYLEDGMLTLHVQFQVIPRVGEAGQLNRVRIQLGGDRGTEGHWTLAIRDIKVEPARSDEEPDTWTKMIGTQAAQIIARLPPREIPRSLDLRPFNDKLPALRLHRIQTENAQLRVSFNLDQAALAATTARPVLRTDRLAPVYSR